MAERPTGPGPLAGRRVLDLTTERGALMSKELTELGAEVILIEPPGGHPLRRIGPFLDDRAGDPEASLTFAYFHAGQRSIGLDLAQEPDRQRARELAAQCDILIEDRQPGELADLGLGPAELGQANQALVYVSLSPFGQTGPRRDWRATDLIGWAAGGPMSVTGPPAGPPLRAAGNQADQLSALWATAGALAATYARGEAGPGQHVDVSQQEGVILGNDTAGFTAIYTGRAARRRGSEHLALVPHQIMPAKDGYVLMNIVSQGQWQEFLRWLNEEGASELIDRPEWHTVIGRLKDRALIHDLLAKWVAGREAFPTMAEAQRRALPIAAVATPVDVLHNPHLAERGFFRRQTIGDREVMVPAGPYLSSRPLPALGPVPRLAELAPAAGAGFAPRDPRPARSTDGAGAPVRPAGPTAPVRGRVTADAPPEPDGDAIPNSSQPTAGAAGPIPWARGPLAGVKVLDFGWMIAGAFASGILGDFGANVIKIEPREVGDPFRGIPPFANKEISPNTSGAFNLYNRNKRGIAVDVRRPEGRDLTLRLIAWADVIVENWSAGTFERLGLDEATIRAVNPNVVWVRMAGFGQTGPHQHYVSVAPTLMAASGLDYLTGPAGGVPTGPGVFWADFVGAVQGVIAAVASLIDRQQTGEGQTIHLAQFEAMIRLLGPQMLDAAAHGRAGAALGNALPDRPAGPHGAYRCRDDDRWIAIAVTTDAEWAAFRRVIGDPEWTADPLWASPAGRAAGAADLDRLVETWTQDQDAWDAAARLQTAGVPAIPVLDGLDLSRHDEHLRARRFYQMVDHPATGPFLVDSNPIIFTGTPLPPIRPAPMVGQHTEEILQDVLGLGQDEIDRLILAEVI